MSQLSSWQNTVMNSTPALGGAGPATIAQLQAGKLWYFHSGNQGNSPGVSFSFVVPAISFLTDPSKNFVAITFKMRWDIASIANGTLNSNANFPQDCVQATLGTGVLSNANHAVTNCRSDIAQLINSIYAGSAPTFSSQSNLKAVQPFGACASVDGVTWLLKRGDFLEVDANMAGIVNASFAFSYEFSIISDYM